MKISACPKQRDPRSSMHVFYNTYSYKSNMEPQASIYSTKCFHQCPLNLYSQISQWSFAILTFPFTFLIGWWIYDLSPNNLYINANWPDLCEVATTLFAPAMIFFKFFRSSSKGSLVDATMVKRLQEWLCWWSCTGSVRVRHSDLDGASLCVFWTLRVIIFLELHDG